jgi:hypothetical protein
MRPPATEIKFGGSVVMGSLSDSQSRKFSAAGERFEIELRKNG